MTDDTQTPLSITDSVSREASGTDTQALRKAAEPTPQYDYATQQDNWDLGGVIAELRARLTVADSHFAEMQAMMCKYLASGDSASDFVDRIIYMLDGPEQRAAFPNANEATPAKVSPPDQRNRSPVPASPSLPDL